MKTRFVILFLLIGFIAIVTKAQVCDIKGDWTGKLSVYGNEIPLVFHFDGEKCTIDSPDQGAKGIPAQLERTAMGIKVAVPSINANYEGVNIGDSVMGTFKQHGQSFPLTLKPGSVKRNRPQTPTPPYPYQAQEVNFRNGDAVLQGTLVTPENVSSQTPVLLMVTGSGLQNRDEEVFEHKPFAVIADALARQGFATLRYDDRGFGESKGDLVNVTTEDLKNDALAGVELLRKQFNRVGILGHSEGGTIGLMLEAEGKVDFVVSLAGCVVSFEKTKVQSSTPYMRYFLALDLTDRLGKITCPVLALNGTKDRQVNSEENLNALMDRLAGQKEIKAIEGLNHMFQHCNTGDPSEYKDIEETFAPEALEIITTWLKMFK